MRRGKELGGKSRSCEDNGKAREKLELMWAQERERGGASDGRKGRAKGGVGRGGDMGRGVI